MANKKYFLDKDGLAYLWLKIKSALSGKVDVETGKGLSSNDYTSAEKTKLANIEAGAQVNVLEGVQVNGSSITPTNKIANIPVPTKTSDITNDSGFITTADIPEGSAASTTTPLMDGTAAVGTELAFARGDHVHPSDTSKVDKVTGKGLSTNDYTTAEKNKLAGIASGAEVNVQANWTETSSTSDAYIKNKPSIPSKTSDLTNDSDFVSDASYVHTDSNFTAAEKTKLAGIAAGATNVTVDSSMSDSSTNPVQNSVVKTYIDNAIGSITGIEFEVVASLPATGENGVIYLVSNSGSSPNVYDEYIWVNNGFEKIGTTDVDLSGYVLSADLVPITNAEIDTIAV